MHKSFSYKSHKHVLFFLLGLKLRKIFSHDYEANIDIHINIINFNPWYWLLLYYGILFAKTTTTNQLLLYYYSNGGDG